MNSIHVINPNSSAHVTEGIDRAIAPMRALAQVHCHTLSAGPPGIESQAHVDGVVLPLLDWAQSLPGDAGALVVACFSDPGVAALREATALPVLGIAESAYLLALTMGQRFGILSLGRASIQRHRRHVAAMGITDRLAGDLPLGLGVLELAEEARTLARLIEVGTALRDTHGADVLITGCAGMAQYRRPLQEALGLPVIDPCQAAVSAAIGRVALNNCHTQEEGA